MSALWSITYLKTTASLRELFDAVVTAFLQEIDDQLYDIESQGESYVDVKTGKAVIEEFSDPVRARLIVDSCQVEWINRGVIVYPDKNGLFTITDTINHLGNVYDAGRARRTELTNEMNQATNHFSVSLFLYINFLSNLTELLNAEAAHIMYERNPATRATAVHFYEAGQFIDDYYYDTLDYMGEDGLIELPEKPDHIEKILDGRFQFLLGLPKIHQYEDWEPESIYFDGEHLSIHNATYDVLNVRNSQLYVPFWDDQAIPFGAVYCPKKALPNSFIERYKS